MKIRFQADADLKKAIVLGVWRREPAIDFKTADAAGLAGRNDNSVLRQAADEGRILVSHDRRTMPTHFAAFLETHPSPGVLLLPQALPVSDAIDWLLLIWAASEASEWKNRVTYLPL